eukprot:403367304
MLVCSSRRNFFQELGFKEHVEQNIEARIDKDNHIYRHPEGLVFDPLGRCLIYDSLHFVQSRKVTFLNTLNMSIGGCFAYNAYFAVPFTSGYFYFWTGFGVLSYLAALSRYADRKQMISRIYLLDSGFVMRVEFANGVAQDLPISSIQMSRLDHRIQQIRAKINAKTYNIKIFKDGFVLPDLLYATLNPQVFKIVA